MQFHDSNTMSLYSSIARTPYYTLHLTVCIGSWPIYNKIILPYYLTISMNILDSLVAIVLFNITPNIVLSPPDCTTERIIYETSAAITIMTRYNS